MPSVMHKSINRSYLHIVLSILLLLFSSCSSEESYHHISGFAQGGIYNVTYSDNNINGKKIKFSPSQIEELIERALLEIDNSFSGYNKNSTLSSVNANKDIVIDSLFIDLFNRSKEIYLESDGIFDISAAPFFDIWGFGFTNRESITQEKIDSIRAFVGMERITISENRLTKSDPRIKLNFNAIAQGYTCDHVALSLESAGICNYLIEVGGEIRCKGKSSRGGKWRVAIDAPIDGSMNSGEYISDIIEVTDVGMVTSGNYRKFYIENGEKYSHTIDPRTGYPVKHNLLSATILAKDATIADAYATWCMVIGLEESIRFLESREDLEGYLVYDENGVMKVYSTKGVIFYKR